MAQEAITLTDEQQEFIKERFVLGVRLLDRVTFFKDVKERFGLGEVRVVTRIHINTKLSDGVTVYTRYYNSLAWFSAYPDEVIIEFKKEPDEVLTMNKTHAVGETGMPKEETNGQTE